MSAPSFAEIIDKEIFNEATRIALQGFCSNSSELSLAIAGGWLSLCDGCRQKSTFGLSFKEGCSACERTVNNYLPIPGIGPGIFSCWEIQFSFGSTAYMVIYDQVVVQEIISRIREAGLEGAHKNYLRYTGESFDSFLNKISPKSPLFYVGSVKPGTTTLPTILPNAGLLIIGEAGMDRLSNSPLLRIETQPTDFSVYVVRGESDTIAALLLSGACVSKLGLGTEEVNKFSPEKYWNFQYDPSNDFVACTLNRVIREINYKLNKDKFAHPEAEALATLKINDWILLERAIDSGMDFDQVCDLEFASSQSDWIDMVKQLRGRQRE